MNAAHWFSFARWRSGGVLAAGSFSRHPRRVRVARRNAAGTTGGGAPPLRRALPLASALAMFVAGEPASGATVTSLGPALAHPDAVHGVALSADGKWAATGCSDHFLRLWETATGKLHGQPLEHGRGVYTIAFSPDSTMVVAGSEKGAKLWEVASGKLLATFPHPGFVYALAFRPDGLAVLTSSHDGAADGTARLWDVRTGKPMCEPIENRQRFYAVAFSPDSKLAAVSGNGTVAHLLDATTGKSLGIDLKHEGSVRSLSFSPDSKKLLTGSLDHTARVWDVTTGEPLTPPLQHADEVRAAVFNPLGTSVLTGSADKTARVWDAATGQPLTPPLVCPTGVRCVAFSRDGTLVANGCYGNTAHVWDAAAGKAIGKPIQHGGLVRAIAFGPDSRVLLTGSFDKTARLWRIERKHSALSPSPLHAALTTAFAVRSASAQPPAASSEIKSRVAHRAVDYKVTPKGTLQLHIDEPKERQDRKLPAIVFFHGGGSTADQFFPQSTYLAYRGMVAISVEYRLKNEKTPLAELIQNGKSAMRWVRTHAVELGIDPDRVIAAGGSAGGHVAACAAILDGFDDPQENTKVSAQPFALVLFNPLLDTTETGYAPIAKSLRDLNLDPIDFSPAHHIRKGLPPTIMFHGTADGTVPFENTERVCRLITEAGAPCELVSYEGKGHGFFNFQSKEGDSNEVFWDVLTKVDGFLVKLGCLKSP